jgi:hypothetical protein
MHASANISIPNLSFFFQKKECFQLMLPGGADLNVMSANELCDA